MCLGCWNEYGCPQIRNEKVEAAVGLIKKVYEFNMAGGGLHVMIDDWNLEDVFFNASAKEELIAFQKHHKFTEDQVAAELECFDALAAMTVRERASALYFHSYGEY